MKKDNQSWKVIDILKTTTDYFNKKQIENPRLNAEQLLAHVLNLSRVQLYLQFEKILNTNEISSYRNLIRRRTNREPLQYILGETEFMGIKFKVSPATLIPRPETEHLVEKIIDTINTFKLKRPSIIDIGTGSGCIAISLANYFPNSFITATDISQDALDIAEINAKQNNIKNIDFLLSDVLTEKKLPVENVDIIVSNPPYVAKSEMKDLPEEIKYFEPEIALTDYKTGLVFYEKILSLIDKDLKCKFTFMEINSNLKQEIMGIASKFSFTKIEIIPDLNNHPRILKIEI